MALASPPTPAILAEALSLLRGASSSFSSCAEICDDRDRGRDDDNVESSSSSSDRPPLFGFFERPPVARRPDSRRSSDEDDENDDGPALPSTPPRRRRSSGRMLKEVVRFDPSNSDASPRRVRVGEGFACPRCERPCPYDVRSCPACRLDCYYEAGVGPVVLRERHDLAVTDARRPTRGSRSRRPPPTPREDEEEEKRTTMTRGRRRRTKEDCDDDNCDGYAAEDEDDDDARTRLLLGDLLDAMRRWNDGRRRACAVAAAVAEVEEEDEEEVDERQRRRGDGVGTASAVEESSSIEERRATTTTTIVDEQETVATVPRSEEEDGRLTPPPPPSTSGPASTTADFAGEDDSRTRKNVASCDSNGEGERNLVGTGAPLSSDRPSPSSSPRSRSLAGPERNSHGPRIASTTRDDANDVLEYTNGYSRSGAYGDEDGSGVAPSRYAVRDCEHSHDDDEGGGEATGVVESFESEEPFGRGRVPVTLLPPLARTASDRVFSEADEDPMIGPRRLSTWPRKFQRTEGGPEDENSSFVPPSEKGRRTMQIKRDAIATDIRPWNGHSAIMSPLTCDVGTYSIVGPSDDVTRGDSLEPEFGLSIEYGDSEVPGTLLPSPALTLPSRLSAMDDFGHREQRSSPEAEDDLLIGPRRVSSSPNKSRQRERDSEREDSLFGLSAQKKRRVYIEPASTQNEVDAFTTHIRPWSVQSEPVMSPLTFDVRTYPIAAPTEEVTRRDSSKCFGTRNACPPQDQTTQSAAAKTLYVAYDVLDPVEIRALEIMHHQGFLRVVLDGIQGVTISPGRCKSPFPAILVTHGVDKSGGITTCYRSCSYLTAVALGALVVDARWLIDSQHAGFLLNCEKYEIRSDLESHSSLTAVRKIGEDALDSTRMSSAFPSNMTLFHKLDGITLGLLKDLESSPPEKSMVRNVSQLNSQLRLETRRITSQEIESLVTIIGGRIITDELTHSDILLVDDWMTFNQITKALQRILAFSNVNRWSIRKCQIAELSDFIVEGSLADHCRGGIHAIIPIIRSKWLEDSICLNSLLCLDSYCLGILCP